MNEVSLTTAAAIGHLVCHAVTTYKVQGEGAINLVVPKAAEVICIVWGSTIVVGRSLTLRLVDAHGPLPTADLVLLARAGAVALGLAVLVEIGLRTTAPALVAVLGREELITLALVRALLNAHREQIREAGVSRTLVDDSKSTFEMGAGGRYTEKVGNYSTTLYFTSSPGAGAREGERTYVSCCAVAYEPAVPYSGKHLGAWFTC